MARDEVVNFRPDPETLERLRTLAAANRRALADELRAASDLYVLMQTLARVRSDQSLSPASRERIEYRLKLTFGQIFLAAIPDDVDSQFEHDLGVEYPNSSFGSIDVPFEAFLEWLAVGRPTAGSAEQS